MALSTCDTGKWSTLEESLELRSRGPFDRHNSLPQYELRGTLGQSNLLGQSSSEPSRQRQRRLRSEDVLRLSQLYRDGATVYELAITFGCHRTTVATRLRSVGVSMRGQSPSNEIILEMKRLHTSGISSQAIGELLGFCANTMRKYQRRV